MPARQHPFAVLAAVAFALAGCSGVTGADATPTRLDDTSGTIGASDPGVGHVHGLGVDPADGMLYAATHYGLFRVPATATATRAGDRQQDTMGFTVTGPNTFLGSGHPDVQKDPTLPPRLGLIRSADAGSSWQGVSLSGKADFHALRVSGTSVYGLDSATGGLLASVDAGRSWETRGRVAARDLAVDPARPDVLLATTQEGLVRSTDGARAWESVVGSPLLAVLAWSGGAGVFGTSPDGTVHRSDDGGLHWRRVGAAGGPPEAMTADGTGTVFVAVADRGVVASRDAGATFARYGT